jgi:choline kinase
VVDPLQGAIIAAGRGERLRKSGEALPKPLVQLGGQSLLVRQIYAMLRAGVDEVLAVVNSETARLIETQKVELPGRLKLFVRDTANSMESLFVLGEKLARGSFLLATVDAVIPEPEFARFVRLATEMTASGPARCFDGALALARWRGDKRPLFVRVGGDGAITALGDDQAPTVTAGVYLLPTRVFDFVASARKAHLAALRQFLAMLVGEGMRLGVVELADVIDVDETADLEAARARIELSR